MSEIAIGTSELFRKFSYKGYGIAGVYKTPCVPTPYLPEENQELNCPQPIAQASGLLTFEGRRWRLWGQ